MRAFRSHIHAFFKDEEGSTLVEYGIVMGLFLFLIFGLIDFSRIGFSFVMAQKATEQAVREAAIRTPSCAGLPSVNLRGTLEGATSDLRFGAACSTDANLCASPEPLICTAATGTASATAIWSNIQSLLPTNATPENLQFTYRFDPNLGFLGGPYTPLVTVEVVDLDFEFVTPLGALAGLAGAQGAENLGQDFEFPSMSASLTSEALGRSN